MLVIDDILMEYLFQRIRTVRRDPRGRDILPEKNERVMERRRSGKPRRTAFAARRPPGSQIALLVAGQAITHGTWQEVQFVRGRESRDSGTWCKFSREPVGPPPGHARAAHRAPAGLAHGYQRLPCPAACLVPTRPGRDPGFLSTAPLFSWTAL